MPNKESLLEAIQKNKLDKFTVSLLLEIATRIIFQHEGTKMPLKKTLVAYIKTHESQVTSEILNDVFKQSNTRRLTSAAQAQQQNRSRNVRPRTTPTPEQAAILPNAPNTSEVAVVNVLLQQGPIIPQSPGTLDEPESNTLLLHEHERIVSDYKKRVEECLKQIADHAKTIEELKQQTAQSSHAVPIGKVLIDKNDYQNLQEMVQLVTTTGLELARRSKSLIEGKSTRYRIGNVSYEFDENEAALLLDSSKKKGIVFEKIKLVSKKVGLDLHTSSLTGKGNNVQKFNEQLLTDMCKFLQPHCGLTEKEVRAAVGIAAEQIRAKAKAKQKNSTGPAVATSSNEEL